MTSFALDESEAIKTYKKRENDVKMNLFNCKLRERKKRTCGENRKIDSTYR